MVDDVVPREVLEQTALRWLTGTPHRSRTIPLLNNRLATRIIAARVLPGLNAQTRGNYPAVSLARRRDPPR